MAKRSFLLSRAKRVSTVHQKSWTYDDNLQLNITTNDIGVDAPVCTLSSIITNSKTEAAPGDDDPDQDAEKCY